jgi:hypothetical protein
LVDRALEINQSFARGWQQSGWLRLMEIYLNVIEWGQASTAPKPPPSTIFKGPQLR